MATPTNLPSQQSFYYHVNDGLHGDCVIFANSTFNAGTRYDLSGSEMASLKLASTFKNLGYDVTILKNLSHGEYYLSIFFHISAQLIHWFSTFCLILS